MQLVNRAGNCGERRIGPRPSSEVSVIGGGKAAHEERGRLEARHGEDEPLPAPVSHGGNFAQKALRDPVLPRSTVSINR